MTKKAVVRQFFMDFLENLGDYEFNGYEEEESLRVMADLFFSGLLVLKWNPEDNILLVKALNEKEEDGRDV